MCSKAGTTYQYTVQVQLVLVMDYFLPKENLQLQIDSGSVTKRLRLMATLRAHAKNSLQQK